MSPKTSSHVKLGKIAVALASLLTLGACFSVSNRALANGRALGPGTEYQILYGDHSIKAQHKLFLSATPLLWQQPAPRPYGFGWK